MADQDTGSTPKAAEGTPAEPMPNAADGTPEPGSQVTPTGADGASAVPEIQPKGGKLRLPSPEPEAVQPEINWEKRYKDLQSYEDRRYNEVKAQLDEVRSKMEKVTHAKPETPQANFDFPTPENLEKAVMEEGGEGALKLLLKAAGSITERAKIEALQAIQQESVSRQREAERAAEFERIERDFDVPSGLKARAQKIIVEAQDRGETISPAQALGLACANGDAIRLLELVSAGLNGTARKVPQAQATATAEHPGVPGESGAREPIKTATPDYVPSRLAGIL